jgi:aspartyl-tRNA(Asn)/glutamyl-tRNA(Gln) amidotransferase subunit A
MRSLIGQVCPRFLFSVEEDVRTALTRLVHGFNTLGLPVLPMPCGRTGGLPIGLQIVGPPFREAGILRVGAVLETHLEG